MEVRKTAEFFRWLASLRDLRARSRILVRIDRLELGNFGNAKFFQGIGELRIDYGPGYRVYFVRKGDSVVILMCGGEKSSQQQDIRKALDIAKELK